MDTGWVRRHANAPAFTTGRAFLTTMYGVCLPSQTLPTFARTAARTAPNNRHHYTPTLRFRRRCQARHLLSLHCTRSIVDGARLYAHCLLFTTAHNHLPVPAGFQQRLERGRVGWDMPLKQRRGQRARTLPVRVAATQRTTSNHHRRSLRLCSSLISPSLSSLPFRYGASVLSAYLSTALLDKTAASTNSCASS